MNKDGLLALKEFAESIDPKEYDQQVWNTYERCGCLKHHLEKNKGYNYHIRFTDSLELDILEHTYIFGTKKYVQESSEDLGFSIPESFELKDAIERIQNLIDLCE